MNITFSEQEHMLQRAVRELLQHEVPTAMVQDAEANGTLPRSLWHTIAQQGWLGLGTREADGGGGGSLLESAIVLTEMGRVACPGPYAEHVAAIQYLARTGSQPGLIAALVAGKEIATIAIHNAPDVATAAADPSIGATQISGAKILVPYGMSASLLVLTATANDRLKYVRIQAGAAGLRRTPQQTMSANQHVRLDLDGVHAQVLGLETPLTGSDLLVLYRVARDAYSLGLLERMLELSLNYARDRVQFGRPIGSFQAVQHQCADMALLVYGAQCLLWQAAWLIGTGRPAGPELSMCHAFIREAAGEVAARAHQVHGAVGFTAEYPLGLFSRRAKAFQVGLGSATQYREDVATLMGAARNASAVAPR